jgi:WD40 repeat protein
VNCIDYYSGGDKPYLASGGDDRAVKIWDYQVSFVLNYKNKRNSFFF